MFTWEPGRWSCVYTYAGREKRAQGFAEGKKKKQSDAHEKWDVNKWQEDIEMREAGAVEKDMRPGLVESARKWVKEQCPERKGLEAVGGD